MRLNTSEDKHRESFPEKDLTATTKALFLWNLNKHNHPQDKTCLIHTHTHTKFTQIYIFRLIQRNLSLSLNFYV